MKLNAFLILCCLCAGAYAAGPAPQPAQGTTQPATTQPANPPVSGNPPPAAGDETDGEAVPGEPQITITKKGEMTVEEYRVGGKLYMIKITPKRGKPYYLVDDRGDGRFARQDPMDFGVRPPMWVIKKF
jgi:hypothetical protein